VTDGNGTTENIDFFRIQVQNFSIGESNDTESLINLIILDFVLFNASVFECLGNSQRRRHREQKRFLRINSLSQETKKSPGKGANGREAGGYLSGISPSEDFGDGREA
jgi:meiotically up-regulated gene 157 (Mug157) protein